MSNEIELRKYCLDLAIALRPKDAGDLIKKAAGIYSWIIATTVEKVVEPVD